ncbi:MAG: endonuclease MutS2, partial [Clostridia bacterium]|nr:endonuclease MutS2 [Clostridia bacterium]
MFSEKVLNALEYDKVLVAVSGYAVLGASENKILKIKPENDFLSAQISLDTTAEADKLLYSYAVSGVDFFDEITDELDRASKGAVLSAAELLRVMRLLKSSRLTKKSITSVDDGEIIYLRRIAEQLFCDAYLENDINEKIISEDKISDNASETLYQIRKKIKRLNEQIREKLSSYLRGGKMKYLQENIITMRGDRYVIPVKSEFRGQVKGLVHDQSSTGATVFIEPEAVLELNNDLKTATIEENVEIEKILSDLSHSVGALSAPLSQNIDYLSDIDVAFAKAEYAYKTKSVKPDFNDRGTIDIIKGRHPLIDTEKVVPLNVSLGKNYNYLLITGPNTGGKTVSLKLVGLFTLMASSGLFVPSASGTRLSYFDSVYADIGDEQSIEQSLSTFSSHMKNIIEILSVANDKSLVLLDEIGAGTDPDEGGALAQAIIEKLLENGSYGIITTHYSRLKEFAYSNEKIMNACMDFDAETFEPVYRIVIGMPGSSNAIEISKRLGMPPSVADAAYGLLTVNKINFESVLREAEKSRREAEEIKNEYYTLRIKVREEYDKLQNDRAKFDIERQRFLQGARAEARRIVNEKTEEAEELISEIKEILKKDNIDGGDVINASSLRNKIENVKYDLEDESAPDGGDKPVDIDKLKEGDAVFIRSLGVTGYVVKVSPKKKEAEVTAGSVRLNVKVSSLFIPNVKSTNKQKNSVTFTRDVNACVPASSEINVIGMNVDEAIENVSKFVDLCVVSGAASARIVHGKGMNILGK